MTDTKTQTEKFKQMAKELEANDNEKSFDEKLKVLAKTRETPVKSN